MRSGIHTKGTQSLKTATGPQPLLPCLRYLLIAMASLGCINLAQAANPELYYAAPSCEAPDEVIVQFRTLPSAAYSGRFSEAAFADINAVRNYFSVSGSDGSTLTINSARYNEATHAVKLKLSSNFSSVISQSDLVGLNSKPAPAPRYTVSVTNALSDTDGYSTVAASDDFQYSANTDGLISSVWFKREDEVLSYSNPVDLNWSDINGINPSEISMPGGNTLINPLYVTTTLTELGFNVVGEILDFGFCTVVGGVFELASLLTLGLFDSMLDPVEDIATLGGCNSEEEAKELIQRIDQLAHHEGFLKITTANNYQFQATVNDGIRLYLEDQNDGINALLIGGNIASDGKPEWFTPESITDQASRAATRLNPATFYYNNNIASSIPLDNEGRNIAYVPIRMNYEYFLNATTTEIPTRGIFTSTKKSNCEDDGGDYIDGGWAADKCIVTEADLPEFDLKWRIGGGAFNTLGSLTDRGDNQRFSTCVAWEPLADELDNFRIDTPATMVGCTDGVITITAQNNVGGTLTTYNGTITISTSDGKGDWKLASGNADNFDNGTADDGIATYTFSDTDNGVLQLSLSHLYGNSVSITVEDSDEGVSSTSNTIAYRGNHSVIVDVSNDPDVVGGGNYSSPDWDVVAGRNHQIKVQMQNASSGTCETSSPTHTDFSFSLVKTVDHPDKVSFSSVVPNIKSTLLANGDAPEYALDSTKTALEILLGAVGNSLGLSYSDETVAAVDETLGLISLGDTLLETLGLNSAVESLTNAILNLTDDQRSSYTLTLPDSGDYNLNIIDHVTGEIGTTSNGNALSVRPFGFKLAPEIDGLAVDLSDLNSELGIGPVLAKAGETINLNIVPVEWDTNDDADGDGLPDVGAVLTDNTVIANFDLAMAVFSVTNTSVIAPAGGHGNADVGNVAGGLLPVSFDDVGIIEVSLEASYLNAVTSIPGTVRLGRFVPARFALATDDVNDTNIGTGDELSSSNTGCNFTFVGQDFSFNAAPEFSLQALNTAGAVTQNYLGAFNKFADANNVPGFSLGEPGTADSILNLTPDITVSDGTSSGKVKQTIDFGTLSYTRTATPSLPFTPSRLTVPTAALTDTDGVFLDDDNDGVADNLTFNDISGTEIIYGRVVMDNVYGPETNELTIPYRTEFYKQSSGSSRGFYVLEADEGCAGIDTIAATLDVPRNKDGEPTGGSGSLDPSKLIYTTASGDIPDYLLNDLSEEMKRKIINYLANNYDYKYDDDIPSNVPNVPTQGVREGRYQFAIGAPGDGSCEGGNGGKGCAVTASLGGVPDYLQWDHDGDGDPTPKATATFGIYQGQNQPVIFRKQAFR